MWHLYEQLMKFHAHLDIESALKTFVFDEWRGVCRNPTGDYLSPDEVKEGLKNQLTNGQRVIPACPPEECPNFDYVNGRPGHED